MKKSRILITGGSGFIGTNLIAHLVQKGHEVTNIDINCPINRSHDVYWMQGDILDRKRLKEVFAVSSPEYVVHLAARTDLAKNVTLDDYEVNTKGTKSVLETISESKSVNTVIIAQIRLCAES